jgi:NADPH2:quinone reductase
MKAISVCEFGGPEVLKLEDVPDPRPPQSGEVLISVNAAGVNPYDTYMRSGSYGSGNPALPFVPGSDAAGVVESTGAEVDLTLGQRVYTTGRSPAPMRSWRCASAPRYTHCLST